jgi:hypothetical protein
MHIWRPKNRTHFSIILVSVAIVPSFSIPMISKNVTTNLLTCLTVLNFHPASLVFFKFQKPTTGFVHDVDKALRNIGLFILTCQTARILADIL